MSKKYYYLISVIVLVVAVFVLLVIRKDKGEKLVPLKANVFYTDKFFSITNKDTFDFIHSEISIDSTLNLGISICRQAKHILFGKSNFHMQTESIIQITGNLAIFDLV